MRRIVRIMIHVHSQMIRYKRHFVISVIAINVFYCISFYNISSTVLYSRTVQWTTRVAYRQQCLGARVRVRICG